jgi:hypothetical protein
MVEWALPASRINQFEDSKHDLEHHGHCTTTIEHDVNQWMKDSKVKVLQIFGNVAPQTLAPETVKNTLSRTNHPPSDVMLVVLYETA